MEEPTEKLDDAPTDDSHPGDIVPVEGGHLLDEGEDEPCRVDDNKDLSKSRKWIGDEHRNSRSSRCRMSIRVTSTRPQQQIVDAGGKRKRCALFYLEQSDANFGSDDWGQDRERFRFSIARRYTGADGG